VKDFKVPLITADGSFIHILHTTCIYQSPHHTSTPKMTAAGLSETYISKYLE